MKIVSRISDKRIDGINLMFEMSIREYLDIIKDNIYANEYQRKIVRSSKTVYALLREDLLKGCVMPSIVLALNSGDLIQSDDQTIEKDLEKYKDKLIILDGLQRTNTLLKLVSDLNENDDHGKLNGFLDNQIRVEIYLGLNRLGVLYRMLTLNTGQTQMSMRQQIEMLYSDYADNTLDHITLIRESDNRRVQHTNEYSFKDMIDGFNSYLERDPTPIDRISLLDNITSLEKVSQEDQHQKLFENFVEALDKLLNKFSNILNSDDFDPEDMDVYGKNVYGIFKKSISISGFGAAVGKLVETGVYKNITEVIAQIDNIDFKDDPAEFFEEINEKLIWLKNNSKKIGNAQRAFMWFFFRELLNRDGDNFNDFIGSVQTALSKYKSQYA